MKSMKGQAAIETLAMVGFVLAFSLPIVFLLFTTANIESENIYVGQARVSAKTIADVSNRVYSEGEGSNRLVLVSIPENTLNVTTENYEVVLKLETSKGEMDVVAVTYANITNGTMPLSGMRGDPGDKYISSGLHVVNVTSKGDWVEVSYAQ